MTSRDANDRRYPSFLRSTEVGLNGSLLAIRCRKCLKVLPEPGTDPAGDPIFEMVISGGLITIRRRENTIAGR
jgi:hypothetical protein